MGGPKRQFVAPQILISTEGQVEPKRHVQQIPIVRSPGPYHHAKYSPTPTASSGATPTAGQAAIVPIEDDMIDPPPPCLNPVEGPSYKSNSNSLLERLSFVLCSKPQLFLFFTLHSFASVAVFLHFFTKKWLALDATIPPAAPHYWQKHIVPPVEFGAMHCLLYQMIVLPLTMCRHTLTVMRNTALSRYMPINDTVSIHIFLGTLMFTQLLAAFVLFLIHFGSLCAWHRQGSEPVDGCSKFTEEIMITGYVILALVLLMGVSSFFRKAISFEAFKYTHYLFVPLYGVTILHTLDAKGRSGMHERSQAWFWLLVPSLLYAADVLYGLLTLKRVHVLSAKLVGESKAAVLRLSRPRGFTFEPGQYVRVRAPSISSHEWHPFNIASAPQDQRWLELYVQVVPGGWTERLFRQLQDGLPTNSKDDSSSSSSSGGGGGGSNCSIVPDCDMEVVVDGPHGSTFQQASAHRNLLAAASGSGVAPLISLMRSIALSGKLVASPLFRQFHDVAPSVSVPPSSDVDDQQPLSPSSNKLLLHDSVQARIARYCAAVQLDLMYSQAVHYRYVYMVFLVCGAFDLLLLGISFSLYSLQVSLHWPMLIVNILTSFLIAAYVANFSFWRAQQSSTEKAFMPPAQAPASTWALEIVIWVAMAFINYQCYLEGAQPSMVLLVVGALLRLYRCLWTITHTPLLLQNAVVNLRPDGVSLVQRTIFVWACQPDEFEWLGPELMHLAESLREGCGPKYFHPFIYIRQATAQQRQDLLKMVDGSVLDGCLHFSRLDGAALDSVCSEVVSGSHLEGSVGVYYCGNRHLAVQLRRSIITMRSKYAENHHPLIYGAEDIFY